MKSNNTYLLQIYVKKCKININQSGSINLLLRAGKSQSHITQSKPLIKGIIDFNTNIKLNIDSTTLDTQRCSLTLNFVSADNIKKVVGIVVINLPPIGQQIQKTFKITSTPDKQAQIQLTVSLNQLDQKMSIKSKPKPLQSYKLVQNNKHIQSNTKQKQKSKIHQKQKLNQSQRKNIPISQQLLLLTKKSQQNPTSPPSQSTFKLNLKSKGSQIQIYNSQQLLSQIDKLSRQKQCLKQLLKLQIQKSKQAYLHLKNIIQVLQVSIGVNLGPSPIDTPARNHIYSDSSVIIKKAQSLDINKLSLHLTTPSFSNFSSLGIVKQSKFQDKNNHPNDSRARSHISFMGSDKSSDLLNLLNSLKKKMQDNGHSKDEIKKLFEKIKNEPKIEYDGSKARILKTKIDKSYLGLLSKQTISKQQILKHKIDINKILDQTLNPVLNK